MATIERAIPVGGASLNFKVVGGTAEPANPKENTIWVNTDAEVTGWAFSAEEPYSSESTVNCSTGKDATYIAADGAETYYPASVVTEYIALPAGTAKITVNNSDLVTENMYHAFYTANKTLISTVERKKGSTTYQVPSGAVYVRLTVYNSRDPMSFVATIGVESGFVWVKTAALDTFAFNALKKNAIKVCPVSASQWQTDRWVELDAKIYQDGAWKNLVAEKYVYNSGDTCDALTGGWERYCGGGAFEAGSMYLENVAASGSNEFGTVNKIDLTDVKQIAFYACATNAADNGGAVGASSQKSALNGGVARGVTKTKHESTSPEWYYLDTSNVEGSYYIYAHAYLWASLRVYAIKLIY